MYSQKRGHAAGRAHGGFTRGSSGSGHHGGGARRVFHAGGPRRGGSFGGRRGRGFSRPEVRTPEAKYINKAQPVAATVYTPKHTFADFTVDQVLAKNLQEAGFLQPTPIQDQAIPVALTGKDVVGIAGTGTGKTAAFLIPIINKFVKDRRHMAMVLAPTRELAQQIETTFKMLTKGMRLFSVSCVGGAPIFKQIKELQLGVHIVIGTPGRVQDLIERKKIKLEEFNTVVLDEADRMLDMGFVDDMRAILGGMPDSRHTMLFSATFPPEVQKLCRDFVTDPVTISVKTRDTAASVDQDVVRYRGAHTKIDLLDEILRRPEATKVLIFREMKRHVDELADELHDRGFAVVPLHGDMHNRHRERAVKALASGDAHVLIATDVAARGIDIPDITHVINYDLPQNYETYIHRIGRTGRGSKTGIALTFVPGR
jgi:superfamily II DNA/RNA helicase